MQHLEGITFPARKEEVVSDAESNSAPRDFLDQIRKPLLLLRLGIT